MITDNLNTYDYGAHQHAPILARWNRLDHLCVGCDEINFMPLLVK